MKKLLLLLLALSMLLLSACSRGAEAIDTTAAAADPATNAAADPETEAQTEAAQSWSEMLAEKFGIAGITAPEGYTASEEYTEGSVTFTTDGSAAAKITEAFAQQVWDACEAVTTRGMFVAGISVIIPITFFDAKNGSGYAWEYAYGEHTYKVEISVGTGMISLSVKQS